mgnify:CR=1 FL=1
MMMLILIEGLQRSGRTIRIRCCYCWCFWISAEGRQVHRSLQHQHTDIFEVKDDLLPTTFRCQQDNELTPPARIFANLIQFDSDYDDVDLYISGAVPVQ